jgi:mannose/cellobiose epimerase-like protein (N-acyl-D-glucosamine 2-epimerase family)
MKPFIILLVVLGALATGAALVRGIFIMASGRDDSGRRSNQMMWYRVLFQGATVLLLCLFAGLMSK